MLRSVTLLDQPHPLDAWLRHARSEPHATVMEVDSLGDVTPYRARRSDPLAADLGHAWVHLLPRELRHTAALEIWRLARQLGEDRGPFRGWEITEQSDYGESPGPEEQLAVMLAEVALHPDGARVLPPTMTEGGMVDEGIEDCEADWRIRHGAHRPLIVPIDEAELSHIEYELRAAVDAHPRLQESDLVSLRPSDVTPDLAATATTIRIRRPCRRRPRRSRRARSGPGLGRSGRCRSPRRARTPTTMPACRSAG